MTRTRGKTPSGKDEYTYVTPKKSVTFLSALHFNFFTLYNHNQKNTVMPRRSTPPAAAPPAAAPPAAAPPPPLPRRRSPAAARPADRMHQWGQK